MKEVDCLIEFLNLPLWSGDKVFDYFLDLPGIVYKQSKLSQIKRFLFFPGNLHQKILLVAHADTYWDQHYTKQQKNHQIQNKDGIITSLTPEIGIGADDRAGVAILNLLKKTGHSLLLLDGEEGSYAGATFLMEQSSDIARRINKEHLYMIQTDKPGFNKVAFYNNRYQGFKDFIFSNFPQYEEEPDVKPLFTDLKKLCKHIPGVNISVGYYNQHTSREILNVNEWLDTFFTIKKFLEIDFSNLKF